MRKFVTLSVPCSMAIAALVACEQDPEGGGDFQLDAGVGDVYVPPSPDATAPDAAPDASSPTEVTVSVVGQDGPKENVRVVFHDENGAVLETKLTGPDGKATSTGATPAMASALLATGPGSDQGAEHHIVTWTGVVGGDQLLLVEPKRRSHEEIGSYQVTLPGPLGTPGSNQYLADVGECWERSSNLSLTIPLYPHCVGKTGSVLVTALDMDKQVEAGFSFAKGVNVPTNGSTVDVELLAWGQPAPFEWTLANLPADLEIEAALYFLVEGVKYTGPWRLVDASATSVSVPTPVGFADAFQAELSMQEDRSRRALTRRLAPASSSKFDGNELLPKITSGAVDATNVRRPVVTWTPSSAMAADGGLVRLHFAGPEDASYAWTFIVAPSATTVTAPGMPPEAESFLPASDATPDVYRQVPEVLYMEASGVADYTGFRQLLAAPLARELGSLLYFRLPALALDGTNKISAFGDDGI